MDARKKVILFHKTYVYFSRIRFILAHKSIKTHTHTHTHTYTYTYTHTYIYIYIYIEPYPPHQSFKRNVGPFYDGVHT